MKSSKGSNGTETSVHLTETAEGARPTEEKFYACFKFEKIIKQLLHLLSVGVTVQTNKQANKETSKQASKQTNNIGRVLPKQTIITQPPNKSAHSAATFKTALQ
jgi:hypothetical protein